MATEFMKPLGHLLGFSKNIDDAINEVHPISANKEYLEFVTGKITYKDLSKEIREGLFNPNWDMLDRKKSNLRPIIFLLCMGGLNKNPKKYIKFASALEMIHNGTLIHDDIEDNAQIRRGDKPIYLKYGLDIAVNSANLLYFSPFLFLKKYSKRLSKKVILNAQNSLLEHLNRVTWGQAIDIYWHNNKEVPSIEDYLQMCCYKTGAIDRMVFSFAAALSKQNARKTRLLEDFGEKLGICFQMHDDFSDVCSINRSAIGNKTIGNDISEGKKSIVNIFALKDLQKKERRRFLRILNEQTHESKKIMEGITLIKKSGALEKTLALSKKEFGILKSICPKILNKKYSKVMKSFLDAMERDFQFKYNEFNEKWGR